MGMVDGRFMVRLKSERANTVVYALSYTAEDEFYHHLLTRKEGKEWTLNDRKAELLLVWRRMFRKKGRLISAMTGPMRVNFLEECITKFQDRQYPGLACRLVREGSLAAVVTLQTLLQDASRCFKMLPLSSLFCFPSFCL